MLLVNADYSISATRGDSGYISIGAKDEDGNAYIFEAGDVVRFSVCTKKNCDNVVLQKDTVVIAPTTAVQLFLTSSDTKIGKTISKPVDYWYEVELNPDTEAAQAILRYDVGGARVFTLYPEILDLDESEPTPKPEDIAVIDKELDLTSNRPVENQAVTRAIYLLRSAIGVRATQDITTGERIAVVEGDLVVNGADGVSRKIVFLPDGTCTWTLV